MSDEKKGVNVRTQTRDHFHDNADGIRVVEGHLHVTEGGVNDVIAIYSPGTWLHGKIVK
jgi:hypothetical protein